MRYLNIKDLDVADGPGCRISLFVSGCRRHCKGCFNSETWSFDVGDQFTYETRKQILEMVDHPYIEGFTVLGGEPFEPENIPTVYDLIWALRCKFKNSKSLWAYSGFTYEELMKREYEVTETISMLDVLVDGPFVEDLKDLKLQYCGSRNQRVISIPGTKEAGSLMVYDQYDFQKPIHKW